MSSTEVELNDDDDKVPWGGGTGEVSAQLMLKAQPATFSPVIATAAIAANGSFSLRLPASVQKTYLLEGFQAPNPSPTPFPNANCQDLIPPVNTVQDTQRLGGMLFLKVKAGHKAGGLQKTILNIPPLPDGKSASELIAFSTATGTQAYDKQCDFTSSGQVDKSRYKTNVTYQPGWNIINITNQTQASIDSINALYTTSSGPLNTQEWTFIAETP